jgi:multiple sugar transport system substrate-binding protein
MKTKKLAFAAAAAATLVLGACGNNNDSSGSTESDEIVTELSEDTTVTFWHAMNGAQEESLTKLTEQFMDENPNITQAYPGWLWNAAQDDMLVDLGEYINDDTIGWGDQEEIRSALLEGAQIDGVQYGIPFNKSTEMLFYNADMLDEYGIDVPTNLEELKEASQEIYEKSNGEVVGAGFDSLNNYYAIAMKNQGVDFDKDLQLDSDESKEVINYYLDGVKEGYFRIAGSDQYLSGPFANEQVAMYVGSIAGEGFVKKDTEGKFEYDVAARPEPINLQQGTDLYMFNSATPEQRTAAFEYMKFLTSPEAQKTWAIDTGYMPVVESVLESDEYKNNPETKVAAKLEDATKELFSIPVIENADPAYNEMRSIMENILSNTDQDVDQLIENAKPQLEDAWNQ